MALIEVYHVIADSFAVSTGATQILEGQPVLIDSTGGVALCSGLSGTRCIGIAGDTKATSSTAVSGGMGSVAATNDAAMGEAGSRVPFVNRVSDSFDETKASGQITVYHGGGRFKTNQYVVTTPSAGWVIGLPVFARAGLFTTDCSTAYPGLPDTTYSNQPVGTLVQGPTAADSGVPGVDTTYDSNGNITNSISMGSFIEIVLNV